MLIRQTFESVVMTALYPRSQIDIYIQVLQADGGERSPPSSLTSSYLSTWHVREASR
jgi:ribonuclease PH